MQTRPALPILFIVAACQFVSVGARAETADPVWDGPIPPKSAHWLRVPLGDDLAKLYPARAQREHKTGKATVHCAVLTSGEMGDCTTLQEEPPGYGFGDATVNVAKHFKMAGRFGPNTSIDIPMHWTLP